MEKISKVSRSTRRGIRPANETCSGSIPPSTTELPLKIALDRQQIGKMLACQPRVCGRQGTECAHRSRHLLMSRHRSSQGELYSRVGPRHCVLTRSGERSVDATDLCM